MTLYGFSFALLLGAEVFYLWLARRLNITDVPNERSSHTRATIRGGGVIFFAALMIFSLLSGFRYPWFLAGTTLAVLISFIDDIYTLPSTVRLPVQLAGAALLLIDAGAFAQPIAWAFALLIIVTGVINVFNFMDGINGITGMYGLVTLGSLAFLNAELNFADERLIALSILALLVFGFFNFRSRAVCFAGDVGSVGLAFIITFLVLRLILQTGNYYFILLLAFYGVDAGLTIFQRLAKRENILEAHRSHLYQQLVSPGPLSHLQVAGFYALGQLFVNAIVLSSWQVGGVQRWIGAVLIIVCLSGCHLYFKQRLARV